LLIRLREKLATRGARGIIGLGRQFKIMDDNNSGSIDFLEFKKTMNDYKLGLTGEEIEILFKAFDINRDGKVLYDEFLRIIRGKLNDKRKYWVDKAFKMLDADGSGEITVADIKKKYNARMHPDVKAGKATEEEMLTEFLETFETHHNILIGGEPDGIVTMEEFEEYYANISASIGTDEYFEVMMKNAWKLEEASKAYEKGWRREEEIKASKANPPAGLGRSPCKRGQGNQSSLDNPLKLQAEVGGYKRSPGKRSVALDNFRRVLATRGVKGIFGLARQFKIIDTDYTNKIDLQDFVQVIKDFKIPIDERDIRGLFEVFDRTRVGVINYEDFLDEIRNNINPFRLKLIENAFHKLDKNGSGVVNMKDLKDAFCTRNHPDVKSGKRTEDQVLTEFLETLEMYKNLYGGNSKQSITKEEFIDYYRNISASIEEDRNFESIVSGTWKLREAITPAEEHRRPLTGHQNAPFGTTEEPTDYSTALRPRRVEEVAAGYPSKKGSPQKSAGRSYTEKQLIEGFRKILLSRGTRGILSLKRAFKIADEDNSGHLSLPEFKKIVKAYRLKYADSEAEKLFNVFDLDGSGTISYDELLHLIIVSSLVNIRAK
jgi:Ca2+-binding EF-hand superfamily protein